MPQERVQKKKATPKKQEQAVEKLPEKTDSRDKRLADLDDLLDEIDEVLEVNAEEFVKSYIQKGGQ